MGWLVRGVRDGDANREELVAEAANEAAGAAVEEDEAVSDGVETTVGTMRMRFAGRETVVGDTGADAVDAVVGLENEDGC